MVAAVISHVWMSVTDPMNVEQGTAEKGRDWSANLPRIDKLNQMNDIAEQELITWVGLVSLRVDLAWMNS